MHLHLVAVIWVVVEIHLEIRNQIPGIKNRQQMKGLELEGQDDMYLIILKTDRFIDGGNSCKNS